MAVESSAEEGRLALAWQNRVAGKALRLARSSMEAGASKQAAFVARLARELGISLSVGAYSNYENGRRTVPAAVLIEAARIAGRSIDDLLSEVGEPQLSEWVEGLATSQRLTELEERFEQLNGQLIRTAAAMDHATFQRFERELERQGTLLAEVLAALDRANLWRPGGEEKRDSPARAEEGRTE